jgi:hypothetical protein
VAEPRQSGCGQRNAASATGAGDDADPADNLDTVDICVREIALRLTKVADSSSVRYRITVRVLRGASGGRVNRATVDGLEARPRKARAAIRVLPARAQGGGVTG